VTYQRGFSLSGKINVGVSGNVSKLVISNFTNIKYLESNGNVEDAMYSSAQEWASIGVEKGKKISDKKIKMGEKIIYEERYAEGGESYYKGDGLNKAHISPEEIKESLIKSKNEN
jgi:hypothetical protein